jgi:TRAP-type uncharacterized transport system substrate-binding protein
LVLILATTLVYRYVDPAPPKHFVISTGEEDSNYHQYGKEYQQLIEAEGIKLEVRPSKGAWDNLARLADPHSGVDVAFVQDGLGSRQKNPGIASLGSMSYEPIWIFYHGPTNFTRLIHLKGKTIAIGEHGGETHTMAKKLLKVSGVDEINSKFLETSMDEEVAALRQHTADAAFFMAPPDSKLIVELLKDPTLHLMSMDQAEAVTRQIPYLHHLVLPHGTIDLEHNIPDRDVDLVSPTATLAVRDSIHPALVYLLLKAASKVHRGPGIFEKRHEFPTDKDFAFPLHATAKNFYQSGAPFWLRYLPFWLATLVERFIFLVIPMAALIIPIIRTIPKILQWRIRNRIYQRYGELKYLEGKIRSEASQQTYQHYLEQLDHIEDRVNHMKIPLDFSEYVYSLRGHIQFVRDRLKHLIG